MEEWRERQTRGLKCINTKQTHKRQREREKSTAHPVEIRFKERLPQAK